MPEELIGRSANIKVVIEQSEGLNKDGEPYPEQSKVKKVTPVQGANPVDGKGKKKGIFS